MEKFVQVQAKTPFRVVNAGGYTYHFDKDGLAMMHEESVACLSSEYTVIKAKKPKAVKVPKSILTKVVDSITGGGKEESEEDEAE